MLEVVVRGKGQRCIWDSLFTEALWIKPAHETEHLGYKPRMVESHAQDLLVQHHRLNLRSAKAASDLSHVDPDKCDQYEKC